LHNTEGFPLREVSVNPAWIAGEHNVPVVACELSGDELGPRAEQWARLGRKAGLGRTETEEGLRIRFRAEPAVEQELRALIAAESKCCSWAHWEVRRTDGELILHVSSPPEGAATLHAMFCTGTAPDPTLD
jgi:hypothetical protein